MSPTHKEATLKKHYINNEQEHGQVPQLLGTSWLSGHVSLNAAVHLLFDMPWETHSETLLRKFTGEFVKLGYKHLGIFKTMIQ